VILEFDLGNTAAKWRLLRESSVVASGRVNELAALDIPMDEPVAKVRVASVAGEERERELTRWCAEHLGVAPKFARSSSLCAGVSNAYEEPERLGVDRWLAVIAAFHRHPEGALVVDAGTALTIDLVDARGEHLGGYILPGLNLMQQSLRQDTARIRYTEAHAPDLKPGKSTAEAVANGAALAAAASVAAARVQARERLGDNCAALLTGGDAPLLMRLLGEKAGDFAYSPDLVLDGLVLACPD
jgi:type III pantothenate kinase